MSFTSRLEASLSLDEVRRIDRICDRFEARLQAQDWPPVEAYLAEADPAHEAALLRALLEVELEYLWAKGERPALEEYLRRFPLYPDAVCAAFRDEEEGPDASSDDLLLLAAALTDAGQRSSDRLRIYYRGELVHTAALAAALELGRQRQGEAPPFALTRGQSAQRLVVAPLLETTVSRRHALLQPDGDNHVRVTNFSQVNPIVFSDGRRLGADQSEVFPLPLEMTLGMICVQIDRGAPRNQSREEYEPAANDAAQGFVRSDRAHGLLQRFRNWRRSG